MTDYKPPDMIQYDPTRTLEPFPPVGTDATGVEPAFQRFLPLPTPTIIKQDYLMGIPLKSALTGQSLSDDTIERYIVQAISELEHQLQLFISPITINRERHNYAWQDFFYAYGYLQTNCRPILEVEKLEVAIPSVYEETLVQWPSNWIKVYNAHGTIQVVPLTGSGSILTTMVGSGASFPIRLFSANHFPQFWAISYRSGFERDHVPALLVDLISHLVAIRCLNSLAPIIFPFNSYSLSLDGLGQSVSTPGIQFLNARIQALEAKRQELMEAAKTQYELRLNMSVLG